MGGILFFMVALVTPGLSDGYDTGFAGGAGTEPDPWQIAAPEHLDNLRNYLGSQHTDKHFVLLGDIDLTEGCSPGGAYYNGGQGWVPIGSSSASYFGGHLDGDGHSITGLFINRNSDNQGLFGYTALSLLEDISVENADVTGKNIVGALAAYNSGTVSGAASSGTVSGGYRVGGLVGENNPGVVQWSYSSATVNAADGRIGALVGFNVGGTVEKSHASGSVSGGWYVGGLVGRNLNGSISESFSTSPVFSASTCAGGLVGDTEGGSITNCYSRGAVTGSSWCAGGLVGYLWSTNITSSYSTGFVTGGEDVGGLVGYQFGGSVNYSYWDTETSGQSTSAGGYGRTTGEMTYPHASNTYTGWDFTAIWVEDDDFSTNSGYPYLWWQPQGGTGVEEGSSAEAGTACLHIVAVSPNPASASSSVFFLYTGSSPLYLLVYDVAGRSIARRDLGIASMGTNAVSWDGRDDSGAMVPGGVYFLVLRAAGEEAAARVVLAR